MDKLGDFISRQKWLKPVETALGTVADTLFFKDLPIGEKIRNFFHGTWFGHPLHPAITDVPLGAWTAARHSMFMNLRAAMKVSRPAPTSRLGSACSARLARRSRA